MTNEEAAPPRSRVDPIAVVTGAGSGIGRAIAAELAGRGFAVVATDLDLDAAELAHHGIRVNAVCPGYVATPMQDRELGWEAALRGLPADQVRQQWIDDTPLGRLETPPDVAARWRSWPVPTHGSSPARRSPSTAAPSWTDAGYSSTAPRRAACSLVRLPRHQKNTPMTTNRSTGSSSVHR